MLKQRSRKKATRTSRLIDLGVAVLVLVALAFLSDRITQRSVGDQSGAPVINDGDTLTLDGVRIRLVGIDAPELGQTCTKNGLSYQCGRKARETLRQLVKDKRVTCRGNEDDQYGRLLATCHAGETNINRAMVELGWAVSYGSYAAQEATARAARAGMWAGEFQQPRQWRDREREADLPRAGDMLARWGDAVRKWLSTFFAGA